MTKRKSRPPEPEIVVAAIESIWQTYYISEMREEVRGVDDEAILDIIGRIERLDPSRARISVTALRFRFSPRARSVRTRPNLRASPS
jgi:hypothetical protein